MEMYAMDAQNILRQYPSYEVALQHHTNLDLVLMRLKFLDDPREAFEKFISLDLTDIDQIRKYNKVIKHLNIEVLPIEFIVKKIITKINESDNYFPTFPTIASYCGIHKESLEIILAKYATITNEHNYLTISSLLNLINQHIPSELSLEDITSEVCTKITIREEVPINERTLVNQAITFDTINSFSLSFNGKRNKTLLNLLYTYSIFIDIQYELLDFTKLRQKILELSPLFTNKDSTLDRNGLIEELIKYIGPAEYCSLPANLQYETFIQRLGITRFTAEENEALDEFAEGYISYEDIISSHRSQSMFANTRKRRTDFNNLVNEETEQDADNNAKQARIIG